MPRMTSTEIVVNLAAAGVIAAVLGEALWLLLSVGRQRVARLATVSAMAAGAVLVSALVSAFYAWAWPALRAAAPCSLADRWDTHPIAEVAVAFVAWDAAGYAYHWIGHRTRIGWASHRVHHTGTEYDMTLAWRQSWCPIPALVVFPTVALLGFDLDAVVMCAAVSKLWQAVVHTSLPLRLPRWLVANGMTPESHRRHHTIDGSAANLGPVFTIWDRLGGTWVGGGVDEQSTYGVADEADVDGVVALEMKGWLALVGGARNGRQMEPEAAASATDRTSRSCGGRR
ncbi:hypothetical protein BH10ACT3_BH10ACT3_18570 [soil metagenome]